MGVFRMNNEIKERLKSIFSVLLFLVGTTWYWYGPRQDLADMTANINRYNKEVSVNMNQDLKLDNNFYEFTITNKTNQKQNYELIINNDYRLQRKNNCQSIQNNYLKYQLKSNNNLVEQNLGIDGIIYRGVIEANETKEFSIKMSIDKDNLSSNECFYPTIKTTTYNKI